MSLGWHFSLVSKYLTANIFRIKPPVIDHKNLKHIKRRRNTEKGAEACSEVHETLVTKKGRLRIDEPLRYCLGKFRKNHHELIHHFYMRTGTGKSHMRWQS